jgi:hypothetical protein
MAPGRGAAAPPSPFIRRSGSMEFVTWLLTGLAYVIGLIWSLVWFLISGWVSTLLQIAVLVAVIYWLKYGWQRAPYEVWKRSQSFGRFFWSWIRGRDPEPRAHDEVVRCDTPRVRRRQYLDVAVACSTRRTSSGGAPLMKRCPAGRVPRCPLYGPKRTSGDPRHEACF